MFPDQHPAPDDSPSPGEPGADQDGKEPEGFGDAVQAAALMLALVTAVATVGFIWERNRAEAAHSFAVALVEQIAARGADALVPAWTGWGRGPTSETAQTTFRALRRLGTLEASGAGACKVASRFAICNGTRYRCQVSGLTPAGPIQASIGLCHDGRSPAYSFDTLDLTMPATGHDLGNRAEVDVGRDGLIRYGTTPLPPEALPVRMHQRAPMGPLRW